MNNAKAKPCFAHHHMSIAEYGLWTHLRELSYNSKPQYTYEFSDRKIAERFASGRGSGKDAVNDLRQSLARKGFIEWVGTKKHPEGHFPSKVGRILSHEEWAKLHPGKCVNSTISPVGFITSDQSCLEPHQSDLKPSPVGFVTSDRSSGDDITWITTNPSSNMEVRVQEKLENQTSDSAKPKTHAGAGSASTTGEDSPVAVARQVDFAVTDIASTLGIQNEAALAAWRKTVSRLADDGHSPRLVSETLKFYVSEYGVNHVRTEGADGYAVSFPWLLRNMQARNLGEESQ